jgi:hypothetical protein
VVSMAMMKTAEAMVAEGWTALALPRTEETPIPGLLLFADARHNIIMVLGDGRRINLVKVHRLAEDAMRNGFNGNPALGKPGFIADWKKMTALTVALNGEK